MQYLFDRIRILLGLAKGCPKCGGASRPHTVLHATVLVCQRCNYGFTPAEAK